MGDDILGSQNNMWKGTELWGSVKEYTFPISVAHFHTEGAAHQFLPSPSLFFSWWIEWILISKSEMNNLSVSYLALFSYWREWAVDKKHMFVSVVHN